MIGTLKHFWKQNWHRVASAFVFLLVVASIAYSCGVGAKAYEMTPPFFTPFGLYSYDDRADIYSEITIDPNEASSLQGFPDNFVYDISGINNSGYYLPDVAGTSGMVSFPVEVDAIHSMWISSEVTLKFNCLDFTPTAESGYLDQISYNSDVYVAYSRAYSPLDYIWPCYYCSDVDYLPPSTTALVEYSYLDGTSIKTEVTRFQYTIHDVQGVTRSHDSILDQLVLDQLPDNSWITAVEIDLASIIADFVSNYPDNDEILYFEIVQLQRPENADIMSQRFLSALISPSLVVPDEPSDYQQGYLDGRNSALTERLGVVDWLVDAGDSVMNFRLFSVAGTPITIGSIYTVIMGALLIILILKVFAGG